MTQLPPQSETDAGRPLGSFERFFWLINHQHPSHFACAAQIEGPTTIDQWVSASSALQARHPLLSVRVEGDGASGCRFQRVERTPIPLRLVHGDASRSWQAELAREMSTPFEATSAPLARMALLHGADRSVLIFASHHSIADGLAVAFAVRDLLRALSGDTLEPLPIPHSAEELLERAATPPADPAGPAPAAPPSDPGVYRSSVPPLPSVASRRLSADLTTRLRQRARREGTTVHGALCAAMVLAGQAPALPWANRGVRVLSPVDIRELLGAGDDYGLRLSAGCVAVQPQAGAPFWDVARYAKLGLAGAKTYAQSAPLLGAIHAAVGGHVDTHAASQFAAHAFAYEVMVTNLGTLPFGTSFGPLTLETFWGPSFLVGYEGEQTIGVTTVNGALSLLHTSHTPIPSLLEAAEAILASACAG